MPCRCATGLRHGPICVALLLRSLEKATCKDYYITRPLRTAPTQFGNILGAHWSNECHSHYRFRHSHRRSRAGERGGGLGARRAGTREREPGLPRFRLDSPRPRVIRMAHALSLCRRTEPLDVGAFARARLVGGERDRPRRALGGGTSHGYRRLVRSACVDRGDRAERPRPHSPALETGGSDLRRLPAAEPARKLAVVVRQRRLAAPPCAFSCSRCS